MRRPSVLSAVLCLCLLALPSLGADSASVSREREPRSDELGTVLPPPLPALKSFADVVKGAKQQGGFFSVWQNDEKFWIEIKPEQFGEPFFFSIGRSHGIGERGFYGGQMGGSYVAYFKRIGSWVQLIAKNTNYTAKQNTSIAQAVREGFSDSLLSGAPVVSFPHPERKSVVIDANILLLSDLSTEATRLESVYRQPYAFDRRNSSFVRSRATEDQTSFEVSAHYAFTRMVLPPVAKPGEPAPPRSPLPRTLEKIHSLFLGLHYSMAKLPEPYRPRLADDRVGHFVETHWDFTDDLNPTPKVRYVHRWRLEKKDPQAAVSDPKSPIVYWLDKNIPEKYRPAVREGILEWNKAFERIGFRNAIIVKQQTKEDDFTTSDVRHASVRWFVGTDASFAIGPSIADPRTGEILDADIAISDVWTRLPRRVFHEQLAGEMVQFADGQGCTYQQDAAEELDFAMSLMELRDELAPDSPEAEAFVLAQLKDVVAHEVGHTLGLRHNFRASTVYSSQQLSDREFTREHGLSASVMDYNALNIAAQGERQGEYFMSTLGPYDYWAIEYAYKPLDPAHEKEELARIAGRSGEPLLAFATDEEAGGLTTASQGMDPEVNRRDLGADPIAYSQKRLRLSRELWDRLQKKELPMGDSYAVLRRSFESAFGQVRLASIIAAKHIGGVVHVRDHAGSPRAPFAPVPAPRQRAAFKVLEAGLFSENSFRFDPEFMARLSVDHHEREQVQMDLDYSVHKHLLTLQAEVLNQIMDRQVLERILNAESKLKDPRSAFKLSELFDGLQSAIWSELWTAKDISLLRRNLQREHVRHLAMLLTKAPLDTPSDAKSLARQSAIALTSRIKDRARRPGLNKEAKAHLSESLIALERSLEASLQRTGI